MISDPEQAKKYLLGHVRPLTACVDVWRDGNACHIQVPRQIETKPVPRVVVRSVIDDFSYKSRRNARFRLSQTVKGSYVLEATLTYPKEFDTDGKKWHRDLQDLNDRMRRRFRNKVGFFWKMERQRRGAPHFHMLIWGLDPSDGALVYFRKWLSKAWFEVVGSGDFLHELAGTSCSRIRCRNGLIAYVSRYVGKEEQAFTGQTVGRYWGFKNRASIPFSRRERFTLKGPRVISTVNRTLRRYVQSCSKASGRRSLSTGAFQGRKVIIEPSTILKLVLYAEKGDTSWRAF